jgi:hypothetical protein
MTLPRFTTSGWKRATVLIAVLSGCAFASCLCRAQETEGSRQVETRVNPQYPSLARGMRIQGSVKVEAVVAPNGSARTVAIKGGHPLSTGGS